MMIYGVVNERNDVIAYFDNKIDADEYRLYKSGLECQKLSLKTYKEVHLVSECEEIDISNSKCLRYINQHMKAFETWQEGKPIEAWKDENANICIRYESGEWWHYQDKNNEITWW